MTSVRSDTHVLSSRNLFAASATSFGHTYAQPFGPFTRSNLTQVLTFRFLLAMPLTAE